MKSFFRRRLHSLMGFFLLLFLCQHLLINMRAAIPFGEKGLAFVHMVNWLTSLPYLPLVEWTLLGIPFLYHAIWGIVYLRQAEPNAGSGGEKKASLPYSRNKAYSWQRYTSYGLLLLLPLHIFHMRFFAHPDLVDEGPPKEYVLSVVDHPSLVNLASSLKLEMSMPKEESGRMQVFAEGKGALILLALRESFLSLPICFLYSLFVWITCFHAGNGLWSFCLSWGLVISERGQALVLLVSRGIQFVLLFLGLVAIWGSYVGNLL